MDGFDGTRSASGVTELRGLLWRWVMVWNLFVALYVFVRAPRSDAWVLFGVTLLIDIVVFIWQVTEVAGAIRRRRDPVSSRNDSPVPRITDVIGLE